MAEKKNSREDRFTWGAGDVTWVKKPTKKASKTTSKTTSKKKK